ncbi:MAG: serine hydrolase domain-containing protein [Pseudomonadota bacterium]
MTGCGVHAEAGGPARVPWTLWSATHFCVGLSLITALVAATSSAAIAADAAAQSVQTAAQNAAQAAPHASDSRVAATDVVKSDLREARPLGAKQTGHAAAPPGPTRADAAFEKRLRARIADMRDAGAPGILVHARRKGVRYEIAEGFADRVASRRANRQTVWRIASVTKLIVAHLTLDLARRRIIDLQQRLGSLVHGLPDGIARLKLADLLDHSSRVPEYLDQGVFGSTGRSMHDMAGARVDPETLFIAALQRAWDIDPLADHQYANTNYVLVQHAIEAASGAPIETLLKQRLLQPLGLLSTGFVTAEGDLPANHLRGYVRGDTPRGAFTDADGLLDVTRHRYFAGGDGGMWSSMSDLSRILDHIWRTEGTSRSPLGRMTTTLKSDHDGFYQYGYGVMVMRVRCGQRIYGHEGLDLGTVTYAFANADNSRQLILAANLSLDNNIALDAAMQRLRDTVFCR